MTDIKKCEHPECDSRGARFIASTSNPHGKWLCYPHGDEILGDKNE